MRHVLALTLGLALGAGFALSVSGCRGPDVAPPDVPFDPNGTGHPPDGSTPTDAASDTASDAVSDTASDAVSDDATGDVPDAVDADLDASE